MKRGLLIVAVFGGILVHSLSAQDISPTKLDSLLKLRNENKAHFVLIDVRTPPEYASGVIPGVDTLIPLQTIMTGNVDFRNGLKIDPESDTVLIYCRSGHRAGIAKEILKKMGFKYVYNAGGILQWKAAGFKLVLPETKNKQESK